MDRLAAIASLLGAAAAFIDATSRLGDRPGRSKKHLRKWARLRLKAAAMEAEGNAAEAAKVRAVAQEHKSIADELGG